MVGFFAQLSVASHILLTGHFSVFLFCWLFFFPFYLGQVIQYLLVPFSTVLQS